MEMIASTAKFKDIRAVIFDLDGTMIDSVPDIHLALNRMKADFSLQEIDVDQVRRIVGRGSENLVRSALLFDTDPESVEKMLARAMLSFYRHYQETNGSYGSIYPGVIEGLKRMQAAKLRLACVTNKPVIFTEPLLAKTGLYSFFELIYSANSLPKRKPDPFPMQMACKVFGIKTSQALVIGDSINDAQAARAAGCLLFVVPYGYNHGEPVENIDSDAIVDDIEEAARLILPS
jgi:phosphoglycolate phosphatase